METDLFGMPAQTLLAVQAGFEYPQPLTEKYRPRHIADFVGLDKPKKVAANLIASPRPVNLVFVGASGTGKTTLARAIAEDMPAEMHHIPSRECDVKTVRALMDQCRYAPRLDSDWGKPSKMHIVLVDEADGMSRASEDAFLSILDCTNRPPDTLFIFTANSIDKLRHSGEPEENRFLSRCQVIEFSSYGLAKEAADLLAQVWAKETPPDSPAPNFARMVKDAANNVRAAMMTLETAIMCS